jgi:hypothetical protein
LADVTEREQRPPRVAPAPLPLQVLLLLRHLLLHKPQQLVSVWCWFVQG